MKREQTVQPSVQDRVARIRDAVGRSKPAAATRADSNAQPASAERVHWSDFSNWSDWGDYRLD